MSNTSIVPTASTPATRTALRGVIVLVATYLALSILTIATAIVFRNDTAIVNAAVWIRGSIVAVTAALMLRFAVGAAGGSANHYLRLRIVSAIMVVAIAAILLLLPGDFPLWMKFEQLACGIILLVVVIIANSRRVRSLFRTSATR